jgi:capsule polysaccharide modification protein KpsS
LALVTDPKAKKMFIEGVKEERAHLKEMYQRGRWTRAEYKLRDDRMKAKIEQIKAGQYSI